MKEKMRRYIISDAEGRELGESQGESRVEALANLYRLAKLRRTPEQVRAEVESRLVSFRVVH